MAKKLFAVLSFICVAFLMGANAFAIVKQVDKVRMGQQKDATRLVLESKYQTVKPIKTFSLVSPPRFVLDFPETKFKTDVVHLKTPKGGIIKGVRQGLFKPGVTRMVIDLEKPAKPSVFALKKSGSKGHRLVVDLSPASSKEIASQQKLQKRMAAVKAKAPEVVTFDKKTEDIIVVIDAGHGGVDPGAIGKYKTYEKHITLAVAKKVAAEINKKKGYKAYLTRSKDIFVPLSERVKMAQRRRADVFVSVHADAHKNRKVRGGSVYVLSDKSSDREASRLARNANRGDLIAGIRMNNEPSYVQKILIDLTQRETMNKSALLAKEVLDQMKGAVKVRKKKVAFAGFRVLKAPEIPSILVEMSYLSNPTEEKQLRSKKHQQRLAKAIASGVENYVTKHRYN